MSIYLLKCLLLIDFLPPHKRILLHLPEVCYALDSAELLTKVFVSIQRLLGSLGVLG